MELLLQQVINRSETLKIDLIAAIAWDQLEAHLSYEAMQSAASHLAILKNDYQLLLVYCIAQKKIQSEEAQKLLHAALWLNAFFQLIHKQSGDFKNKSKRLLLQQQYLEALWHHQNHELTATQPPANITQILHKIHGNLNTIRNLLTRAIRTFQATQPLLKTVTVQAFLNRFNEHANPVLNYIGWIFFLPRMITNLVLVCRRHFFKKYMSETEKNLPNATRLYLIRKNAHTLLEDTVSVSSGLLNCFLFIRKWASIAPFITQLSFLFDFGFALYKYCRWHQKWKQYRQQFPDNLSESPALYNALTLKMNYKKRHYALQICNTAAIVVACAFTLPVLAFAPIVPLIAQSILLALIVAYFILNIANKNTNPKHTLPGYKHAGFFKTKDLTSSYITPLETQEYTCN